MNKFYLPTKWSGLLGHYQEHLQHVTGFALLTCQRYVAEARKFLHLRYRKARPRLNLQRLPNTAVLDYLRHHAPRCGAGTLQLKATSLRCFFKFLVLDGDLQTQQVPVIPALSSRGYLAVREPLSAAELKRFLRAFDRRTAQGRRNYAAAVCLARLGLRIGEVTSLRLADIGWRKATLRVRCPKGRQDRFLPLGPEVRDALVNYLCRGRPSTRLREVFVDSSGQTALRKTRLGYQLKQAFQQARINHPRTGAHLLRHTLATQLFKQGASLKAVADLLGHRSLAATQRYIRLTPSQLRLVVQPWPKEVL
jgi:site-specific recombinase XerD